MVVNVKTSVGRGFGDLPDAEGPVRPATDQGGVSRANRRPAREIQRENESLRRLVAVSNHLSRLAVQGADLETITAVLARTIGRTVAVLDPLLEPLAVAAGMEGLEPDIAWVGSDPQLVRVLGAVAETREALRIPAVRHLGRPGCVIAPILFGDDVFAYLVTVEDAEDATSDFDLLVIEHAASAYAIGMARNRAMSEISGRVKDDLVDALLLGHVRDAREGRSWAQAIGYDVGRAYRVICLAPEGLTAVTGEAGDKYPATNALRRRILASLAQLVSSRSPLAIVSARPDELVVVWPEVREAEKAVTAQQLGDAAIRHAAQLVSEATLTIGVGRSCDEPADLAQSYGQARQAIAIAQRLGRTGQQIVFEELGIYRLLFQIPEDGELRAFAKQVLGPLMTYDQEHRSDLVRTLGVYLGGNGSLHAAAEQLHVHPNTVNYRLTRIAEIASLCLTDHEDRLAAEIAIKIIEVLDDR